MGSQLTGTITIRLGARSLRLLRQRAKKARATTSDLVRELIERELDQAEQPVSALDLTRQWVGAIRDARLPRGKDAKHALAEWDPDRRARP